MLLRMALLLSIVVVSVRGSLPLMTRIGTNTMRSTATARLPASARWRSSMQALTCATQRPPRARASSASAGGRASPASSSGALTADRLHDLPCLDRRSCEASAPHHAEACTSQHRRFSHNLTSIKIALRHGFCWRQSNVAWCD